MALSAQAAGWFLLAAVPIGFFVAWSDLARMKIPNLATDGLALAYVVLGLIALPFETYLWGYAAFGVMLVFGILLNSAGVLGAGDAKFIASAAPYIAWADARMVILILAACLLAGYVTHRAAKASPLRRMVPHWESWSQGKRFPMGFPLAMTLVIYLGLAVATG